jgi:hypothetical protein
MALCPRHLLPDLQDISPDRFESDASGVMGSSAISVPKPPAAVTDRHALPRFTMTVESLLGALLTRDVPTGHKMFHRETLALLADTEVPG